MSITNKLLFFNKEGYPYNFEYDDIKNIYNGTILFDENSTDTFKTIGLYVFEEVPAINYSGDIQFNKIEFYNHSGVSYISGLNKANISNILSVNSSTDFYSKWIYGENFDKYFPKGSVVSFKDLLFSTATLDFQYEYYTVLDNKPDAIMIQSSIDNNTWDNTFISGEIESKNIISYNDYNNTLVSDMINYNLSSGKKLSIIGTAKNDGVKDYITSGITQTYYQKWNESGSTGDELMIDLTLYTERPKIYQGKVDFLLSGSSANLTFYNNLDKLNINDTIIFEDYNDKPILTTNPIFTVKEFITDIEVYDDNISFFKEKNVNKTKIENYNNNNYNVIYDYYFKISGDSSLWAEKLEINDIILLTGSTQDVTAVTLDSSHKNLNRKLSIKDIKTFKDIRIEYWIKNITESPVWFNQTKQNAVNNNKEINEQLIIDATLLYDKYDNDISSPKYIPINQRYEYIYVNEIIISEDINLYKIIKKIKDEFKHIICDFSPYSITNSAFTMNVVGYSTSNVLQLKSILAESDIYSGVTDYKKSIEIFNHLHKNTLDKYGLYLFNENNKFILLSKYQTNSSQTYFKANLSVNNINLTELISTSSVTTLYLNVENKLKNEEILLSDSDKFDRSYHSEIFFELNNNLNNYGFDLIINDISYYIKFNTDTQTTISDFINKYHTILYNNGIVVTNPILNQLNIDGLYPNVDVFTVNINVNIYSKYDINNTIKNKYNIVSGNELISTNNLFNYGFSTGMIINVYGSTYPSNNKQYNILSLSTNKIELSYQGLFFNDTNNITIKTKTYLRKPRESYNKKIYYSFKFNENNEYENNEYENNTIFFYDISGEHLKPPKDKNGNYIDALKYIGPKPLWSIDNECNDNRVSLIDKPNDNLNEITNPLRQQNVFWGKDGEYCLDFLLDEYDSATNFNYEVEPLQIFLGYNSQKEGVDHASVSMDLIDKTILSGLTYSTTNTKTDIEFEFSKDGLLTIHTNNNFDFTKEGFEIGQKINIDFIDNNKSDTVLFLNYDNFVIDEITKKTIKVKKNKEYVPFFTSGTTSSFKYKIEVLPHTLLTFNVIGETEIEDERFPINLRNLGIELNNDIEHIFKSSDIKEDGIDYKLLNKKRKEMLIMYPEIYNYIGSYKAIINSINFFGWNELELYEYYKNIKEDSPLYQKLHKVKIPDIFDNTIDGWTDSDFVKGKYDNGFYKKTNLFNLTFNITDENGEPILLYSLDEIQQKLKKLKYWLKKYVVPLSANLVDITGVVKVNNTIYHNFNVSNFISKIHSTNENVAVNFNITSTLNFGQNYLVQLDFYTLDNSIPSGWTATIKTFSKNITDNKLIPQQYIKLMKNDLLSYSFNIEKDIDQYIYVETNNFNDYGFGSIYNKLVNISSSRVYKLINNNFTLPSDNKYISIDNKYYWFDSDGFIWLSD
jgi:hypothetical protein